MLEILTKLADQLDEMGQVDAAVAIDGMLKLAAEADYLEELTKNLHHLDHKIHELTKKMSQGWKFKSKNWFDDPPKLKQQRDTDYLKLLDELLDLRHQKESLMNKIKTFAPHVEETEFDLGPTVWPPDSGGREADKWGRWRESDLFD